MSYRVEISVSNRAGCVAPHCKKENIKIQKGEIRQGVLVEINEHQSWKWRHWGCVTPTVVKNWKDKAEGDMDLIDGYEEIPAEFREKVRRTFEQGHVDDEDWNGDVELNRFNPSEPKLPMFLADVSAAAKKRLKKAGVKFAQGSGDEDGSSDIKPAKKRSRKQAEDAEDADGVAEAPPAAKKARSKKTVKDEDAEGDGDAPAAKSKAKAKKARSEAEAEPVKKPRARKAKVTPASDEADSVEEVEEEEDSKTVTARKSKATKKAPAKQASVEPNEDQEDVADKPLPKAKAKGRKKKAAAE